jgi:putative outer membrane protein
MPRLDAVGNQNYGNSSKWIENADYLRLENISLAYNLTKQQTKFADVRLSFGVQNLFTITGYKGADPAGFSFGNHDYENGVDMGGYPAPRTFTLGARFTF